MSELQVRFKAMREVNNNASDIVLLWYAAKEMKYSRAIVSKAFNSCVSKEEYDIEDKAELIDYITRYSNDG